MIGDPLTLEQLRKMDGQPVWIMESPNWGHWELSEDAEDYLCDRDTDLYGLTYPDPDGKGGLHKLGWIAYAYPPAHIDREALEDCPVCGKYKVITFKGYRTKEEAIDMSGKSHPHISGAASFCPRCGKSIVSGAGAERKEI